MAVSRNRSRSMELAEEATTEDKAESLLALVVEVYKLNLAQNAAKREYDKKRKELLGKMKAAKVMKKVFSGISTEEGAQPISLEAKVATPTMEKADVTRLSKLVDSETFLTIVSATKEAIVTFAGTAVFEQCKTEVQGTENVSVSVFKG